MLRESDPVSMGMDPRKLDELGEEVRNHYGNINGIVVVRKGHIVLERYYHGCGPEDTQHVASVAKSVVSALIGIALEAGYIESIDRKVLDFFPEYHPAAADVQKQAVTLRHLLTMTVPYAWKATGKGFEPLDRLRRQKDWVLFSLDLFGRGGRLGTFHYSSLSAHLLSAVITRTTGLCARQFANERLFRHIGMREIPDNPEQSFGLTDVFGDRLTGWVHDPQGYTVGGWGLDMTPRDMARFGLLYLRRGGWDGRQVVPEKWIDESTAINRNNYGYLWWLRDENGLSSYSALGSGGNVICCIPDKDLVVAISSSIIAKPRDRRPLVEKYILSAVKA